MRMGDNHITNRVTLRIGESNADTAGVHRHAIVNEKASQPLRRSSAAGGIKRAW